jgi:predicted nucleotidyltransferase
MIEDSVLSTITFFDLQNLPLTASEVFKYLLGNPGVDDEYELKINQEIVAIDFADVATALGNLVSQNKLETHLGYFCLPGKRAMILERLRAFGNGRAREKRLARYIGFTRHIPFVRGVALAGSQALGKERKESDIDLLVITDRHFLWLARTLITGYFQLLGIRRYHKKVTDRMCLNHYVIEGAAPLAGQNLYTALEYYKLRPLVYAPRIYAFQKNNLSWIEQFFPNANVFVPAINDARQSFLQKSLELVIKKTIGRWLEFELGALQSSRIRHNEKYIVVSDEELSFHPNSKQDGLLSAFYKRQQHEQRVTEQPIL